MVKKVSSGIIGLDALLDGGLNNKSSTVVIGSTGAGKTTMATQFIRKGLSEGQNAIFISLDENKEQIIRDAIDMGWKDILYFINEEKLTFVDASGKEFRAFIKKELPDFVSTWEGANARIAIDPLTPVIWATSTRYEQRELLGLMLKELRRIGTVVATLEEHGRLDLSSPETIIPMYLADTVIHLRYRMTENFKREVRVVKMRGSRHGEGIYPYRIIKGFGVVIISGKEVRRRGREKTKQLESRIIEKMKKASPLSIARIKEILKEIDDRDIENIDIDELAEAIAEEFV